MKERFSKFRQGLRKAFSLQSPHGPLTDEDRGLIDKLAQSIVQRGWAIPAIVTLTSIRPLNSLASQAMVFLRPFQEPLGVLLRPFLKRIYDERLLADQADYDRLTAILDRREGVETIVQAIEAAQDRYESKLK